MSASQDPDSRLRLVGGIDDKDANQGAAASPDDTSIIDSSGLANLNEASLSDSHLERTFRAELNLFIEKFNAHLKTHNFKVELNELIDPESASFIITNLGQKPDPISTQKIAKKIYEQVDYLIEVNLIPRFKYSVKARQD